MTYVTILTLALVVLGLIFVPGLCWRASWSSEADEQAPGEAAFVRSVLWLVAASLLGLVYMLLSTQVLYPVPFAIIVGVMVIGTAGPVVVRFLRSDGLRALVDRVRGWLERKVGS